MGTIAAGGVAAAATRLEQTMGRLVPLVLAFLARLTGLGDVSKPVQALLRRLGNRGLGFFGPMHPRARFTGIRAVRSLETDCYEWYSRQKRL